MLFEQQETIFRGPVTIIGQSYLMHYIEYYIYKNS